jgi:hypothetical protein
MVGEPKCLRTGNLLVGPLHCCPPLATTRIPGFDDPYIVMSLLILNKLSPVPYQGNVVARLNCPEVDPSDHQCHFYQNLASNSWSSLSHFQNSFVKTHICERPTFPRFSKSFSNIYLSVPNLEILLHYKVTRKHDANHQAINPGDE